MRFYAMFRSEVEARDKLTRIRELEPLGWSGIWAHHIPHPEGQAGQYSHMFPIDVNQFSALDGESIEFVVHTLEKVIEDGWIEESDINGEGA